MKRFAAIITLIALGAVYSTSVLSQSAAPLESAARRQPTVADVVFTEPTISTDDRVLFTSRTQAPHYGSYATLFEAAVAEDGNHSITELSYFPERMSLIANSGELVVHNRFGLYRSDRNRTALFPVEGYPNFAQGEQIQIGALPTLSHSPDGQFYLYYQNYSGARGRLILHEDTSDTKIIVSRNIGVVLDAPPAVWSPDSSQFLYNKGDHIYYYSLQQLTRNRVLDESLRRLGPGSLNSVAWTPGGTIFYIKGKTIYTLDSAALFTQGFYSDFLQTATSVGTLPFDFDPNTDSFSVSPQGTRIILNKNNRDLFLYFVRGTAQQDTPIGSSLAIKYTQLAVDAEISQIHWPSNELIVFLTEDLGDDFGRNRVYRIAVNPAENNYAIAPAPEAGIRSLALNRDRRFIALVGETQTIIKNSSTWDTVYTIPHLGGISAQWTPANSLIVAGTHTIIEFTPTTAEQRLITLSQVTNYAFSTDSQRIIAANSTGTANYAYSPQTQSWRSFVGSAPITGNFQQRTTSQTYRVYLEELTGTRYRNRIQIRHLNGYTTTTLFSSPGSAYEPYPSIDDPVNLVHFSHGSRIRSRKVALVFNLIDSNSGLNQILATLRDYNIRATFFVNGNFIRTNPRSTRTVAEARHEIGSLFVNYFDMTDNRYNITPDFIHHGLSSTEDLYHAATGAELALLWHAPYYFSNPEMIHSAAQIGYTYVDRDIDGNKPGSTDAWQHIERIVRRKLPGSIISLRVGEADETDGPTPGQVSTSSLHRHLPLLLNFLLEQGYTIVPVSELIEETK